MTNRPLAASLATSLAAAALAVAAVLAPQASTAADLPQGPETVARADVPLRYVALGDSYSAASGVLPVDPAAPSCLRSTRNYPSVIAERIGARLVDVTCGAAETGDFFRRQNPDTPPQLDALRRGTRLVTMTIGGNDSGVFVNSILQCGAAGLSTAGTGSPCQDRYGSSFERTVREKTFPSLVHALRAVHRRAPHARVAILGYPWIVPEQTGCFPQMPIATGDVPYLRHLQGTLNAVVRRAAARTGSIYVDVPAASDGHDACTPIGTRWVEPVLAGTNAVIVHPNALGERRMAGVTVRRLHLR